MTCYDETLDDGPDADDDPHETCWGIHLGPDGEHYTCDRRPI